MPPPDMKPHTLQPLDPALHFNQRLHTDLLGPLPEVDGKKWLLVMTDAHSKLISLSSLKSKTADEVTDAIFCN